MIWNGAISGFLESWDDFYLMDNGLVLLQTTNGVYNMSLYDHVVTESAPAWVRVRVANQMAVQPSDWGVWFEKWNSGRSQCEVHFTAVADR